jgi:hypothetical protein
MSTTPNLVLRTLNSPYSGDITRAGVLSWQDVDGNFLSLKGSDLLSGFTSGSTLYLQQINGENLSIDLSNITISGGSETFQQVLNNGSNLTQDNTINVEGHNLIIQNNSGVTTFIGNNTVFGINDSENIITLGSITGSTEIFLDGNAQTVTIDAYNSFDVNQNTYSLSLDSGFSLGKGGYSYLFINEGDFQLVGSADDGATHHVLFDFNLNGGGGLVVSGLNGGNVFETFTLGNDGTVSFIGNNSSASTVTFSIQPNGIVQFANAFSFPNHDGLSGQTLVSDGTGSVTWQTISSSGSTKTPIKGIVGGTNMPENGASAYTDTRLIGLATDASPALAQIIIGEQVMSSYGNNVSFTLNNSGGTITLLNGNTFITGQSVFIDLNQ